MKTFVLLTTILALAVLPSVAKSSPFANNCFEMHLLESLEINYEMKEFYSQIEGKKVEKLYQLLMGGEKFSLPVARYFDRKSLAYQKQGMDLFCQEFVSMTKKTPVITGPLSVDYKDFNWKVHKNKIAKAINAKDAAKVRSATLNALLEIEGQHKYHCFMRHMLESIYRFAHFSEVREIQSQQLGIRSPTKLHFQIMHSHNLGLWFADEIDDRAAPIQKNGVPVLCNELPDILKDIPNPELKKLNRN